MTALLLWCLATLDSACSGYRAAAGRSGLICKRAYYRRAVIRGALLGQIAVATAAGAMQGLMLLASDRDALARDFLSAGRRTLSVYLPYAAMILAASLLRLFRSVDIKSLTSTIIFGPLTLIRPIVAVAGLALGVSAASRIEVVMTGFLILAMMLSLERSLGWISYRLGEPTI